MPPDLPAVKEFVLWKCGGPYYRTRDDRVAVVLERNIILDGWIPILQGRIEGHWCEWNLDGTARCGNPDLDLVGEYSPPP